MIQWNALLWVFISLFLMRSIIQALLSHINIRHIKRTGAKVPHIFKDHIDKATLGLMNSYTVETSRFNSFTILADEIFVLVILLSGILPWYGKMIGSLSWHFVPSGLVFLAGPALAGLCLGLPFGIYSTFVIEKKYGFTTTSWTLWISDQIKNILISLVLAVPLFGAFLSLVYYAEKTWWLWGWLLFAGFQLTMIWIYPVFIAPLFNKFEPVSNEELRDKITKLMVRAGLKAEGIFQVDAGKRSRHSNAYFTGLGKTKRIVLYDTLLETHSPNEIVSILAHEIGHWKNRHIIKQILLIEIASFFLFLGAYILVEWSPLYRTFGFTENTQYIGLYLLSVMFQPLLYYVKPVAAFISRKYEGEADKYSNDIMGTSRYLVSALKRLASENLSNLHPHPFFVWFYYSHPPLKERIERLIWMDSKEPVNFMKEIAAG